MKDSFAQRFWLIINKNKFGFYESINQPAFVEQYFPAMLLIKLCKVALESVGEILKCDHSSESY